MIKNDIYGRLGYEGFLVPCGDVASLYPEYVDVANLGADKIYFSDNHPTVLFVDVKSFDDNALKRIAKVQHRAWNYRRVLLLFAVAETEVRVYNCHEKPNRINPQDAIDEQVNRIELMRQNTVEEDLGLLSDLFSRIGVDCGLLWTSDSKLREKIKLQRRVDNFLATTMKATADRLCNDGVDENIVHGLLMRSLFILFLEDKGAAKEAGLYSGIKEGAERYFDVLEDKEATYRLFDEVKKHFNGNVFPVLPNEQNIIREEHLALVRRCFYDGNLSSTPTLFDDWRLFNFEIIEVELLSEIYENFLGALKKERGQHYTPISLVEFILNERLPAKGTEYNVKTLDPACGSGIFLVEGFKRLVKRWKNAHPNKRIEFNDLVQILTTNIFGIEIDATAIRVAAFSLYLALVDELDPKTLWIRPDYKLPYLIRDKEDDTIKNQGNNLWRCDTIQVDPKELGLVDLVVGNPPFGTEKLPDSIKAYCAKHKFAQEQVLPFIHKSIDFCPKGKIALIFNSKVLTNFQKPYQRFRGWLFKNHVEKICNLSIFRKATQDFGGQLFASAVSPVSIVYFSKEAQGEVSETIEYWAPKTFVKSNFIEGVVINSSDVKYLPREECTKPNTKIWKIAMWGNMQDFRLISKLQAHTLGQYVGNNSLGWITGTGLNGDSNKRDINPNEIIDTKKIERYETGTHALKSNTKWYRKNKNYDSLFNPPFILFREGQPDTEIASSLYEKSDYCATGAYVINNNDVSLAVKKMLVSYFNSDIVKYCLFLSVSSWGIERERVLLHEMLDVPNIFGEGIPDNTVKLIAEHFDKIVQEKSAALSRQDVIRDYENRINDLFCQILGLNEREQILISDLLNYQLPMLYKGAEAISFNRTLESENRQYASTLCDDINRFLWSSPSRVRATIFEVKSQDPLNLVMLQFGYSEAEVEMRSVENLREYLAKIEQYQVQEKAKSIYVQKQVRYYNDDTIYLIKPNQKRFWTRSQAMEDASSLISEILTMSEE